MRRGYARIVEIEGSTILVTGASGGIGEAIARELAGAGAEVIAVARGKENLERIAASLEGASGSIRPVPCDLTEKDARLDLFSQVPPASVDVLVNNAGSGWVGNFLEMTEDEVSMELALNIEAVVALCRKVVPFMRDRNEGHVVNIGSILGFAPGPPLTVYSSTKAAVHAFTEGLRRELAGTDVRVTLVAPGPVKDTGALDHTGDSEATSTLEKAFDTFGTTPEAVASAVRTALLRDARPSTRTVTVPRLAGLSRVAAIPGADWAMDRGFDLLKRAGVKI